MSVVSMSLDDRLPDTSERDDAPLTARLCILETTDLHMQLLGYDYFADHPTPDLGLVPLAGLIETYRADPTVTTLLFDNGDFLQGNPLADYVVGQARQTAPHPMIATFNALGYDAVALGNHEFNYGLEVLAHVLQDAKILSRRRPHSPPNCVPKGPISLWRCATRASGPPHGCPIWKTPPFRWRHCPRLMWFSQATSTQNSPIHAPATQARLTMTRALFTANPP